MTGWRRREAVREGLRSMAAGGVVGAAVVGIVSVSLGLPAALDASRVSRLVSEEAEWIAAGGTVLIASTEAAPLDARDCDGLAALEGVDASFGVTRLPGGAGTSAAPDARVAVATVTSGVYSFLDAEPGGALVSPGVRADVGAGPAVSLLPPTVSSADGSGPPAADGTETRFPAGTVPVSDVVSTSVLGEQFEYVVLVPQPSRGAIERCYVRASPGTHDAVRSALPAALAVGDEPVIVSDRLLGGRFTSDYAHEYATRETRFLPFFGGVVAALVWLVVSWFRRGEDSLYRTLGATPTDRLTMRGTEGIVTIAMGALTAWCGVLLVLALGADTSAVAVRTAAGGIAVAAATSIIVAAPWCALPRRDTLGDLKDR